MIRGIVTAEREAVIDLSLLEAEGDPLSVTVVIDTGYTGWLTLPPAQVAALRLSFNRFGRAALADGTEIAFSVYDAGIIWDGQLRQIQVDEVDAEPLVGMSLMQGYKLTVEDITGGLVTLERLG